jgi:hygromycin-B 7''-O-kinase
MRQHLLVEPDPWRLTGLIDFEPAIRGAREYEFAADGVFFAEGDAGLLRRTLASYVNDLEGGGPGGCLPGCCCTGTAACPGTSAAYPGRRSDP